MSISVCTYFIPLIRIFATRAAIILEYVKTGKTLCKTIDLLELDEKYSPPTQGISS